MKRPWHTLAVIGVSSLAACAGDDSTQLNPTDDPGWTPVNDGHVILFDDMPGNPHIVPGAGFLSEREEQEYCAERWQDDPNCIPTALPGSGGEIGQTQQPVTQHCWTGPGFKVEQLDIGNTNLFSGPCYEASRDGSQFDCAFPGWLGSTVLPWRFETGHNNTACTVDRPGGPTGRQIIGDAEFREGFQAWRDATGQKAKFEQTTSGSQSADFSVLCAGAAKQDATPVPLAAAGPWGHLRVDGQVSQIPSEAIRTAQGSLDANYPLQNPHSALSYNQAVFWVYDRNINRNIQECGGTTAQKEQKMRTLGYLMTLHEVGHILGFMHSQTGIMKDRIVCGDLGSGDGPGPRPSVPSVYGTLYVAYIDSRINGAAPRVFADRSFCAQGPAPLAGSNHNQEFQDLVELQ